MTFSNKSVALLFAGGALLAISACVGTTVVPSNSAGIGKSATQVSVTEPDVLQADNTSVLKGLKKDVVIGSAVDPTNGDKGPRALSIVTVNYGLKKGQLLVCNFDDAAGAGGKGTTIDVFDPKPGSKPTTFTQSSDLEGCDGTALTTGNAVYGAGLISGLVAGFTPKGKFMKAYGSPLKKPFSDVDASCMGNASHCLYSGEYIFVSDAKTGSIISISFPISGGNPKPLQVATGFAVNNKTNWSRLGPSGLSYDGKKDLLYIADGKDNTVVVFTHAGELLEKNEIVVLPGGKTFKCKYKPVCGKLVYSGAPLNAPVAMTRLPNGNLIVANTKGGNTLVELTPAGQVLDKKVVDKSTKAGIFGLVATGTNDSNTALFFTDTNDNEVHKLER